MKKTYTPTGAKIFRGPDPKPAKTTKKPNKGKK